MAVLSLATRRSVATAKAQGKSAVDLQATKMASTAGSVLKVGVKQVRPILSVDNADARKRVLNLYKAWYRQIPYIGKRSMFVSI